VGLGAQVSPNDLLVVRSEPFTGSVLGRITPLAVINIIDSPKCAGTDPLFSTLGAVLATPNQDPRASQVCGCAFCIDMHTKDTQALGESEQRLYALDA
jgi:Carboxymuconolactone decarboxylase family